MICEDYGRSTGMQKFLDIEGHWYHCFRPFLDGKAFRQIEGGEERIVEGEGDK